MSQPLYYLAYTSKISLDAALYRTTFLDICNESNAKNKQIGITGFLCFKNGKFFQFIEGEHGALQALYESIRRDKRHNQVTTLIEGEHTQRYFDQWAMHCMDLNPDNEENGEEISEYFEAFDTYQWTGETIQSVIKDLQNYYQMLNRQSVQRYKPKPVSYVSAKTSALTHHHKIFLLMQGLLLLAIIFAMFHLFSHDLLNKF